MEILGSWTYIGDVVAGMEVLDGGAKSIKSKQGVLSVKSSDLRQKSQRREPDKWTFLDGSSKSRTSQADVKSSDLQQKKSKKEREHEHSAEIWNRISPKTP
ncbi:unnamed protein product [Sphagnum jensenii]|uniref:Peptidylprolyl isomerase n=1 Tax=Sphagnum jensenii TaxID=128206 RepID=A0ABP0VGW2_9BRYO